MAGIYIHIPFCRKACIYCDFHFSTSLKAKDEMVKAIIAEAVQRKDYLRGEKIETVYFGGGTPSVLNAEELMRILNQLNTDFSVVRDAEITLEANPDDLTKEKLIELKAAGVNRLSIGLQSFIEEELQWMNRTHTAEQNLNCVRNAQQAGFENITVDLIYGSRFQSEKSWNEALKKVESLNVQHLSCYNLTAEERTVFGVRVAKKKENEVDEELSSKQFIRLMEWSRSSGFEQYEISNFSKEGFISQHNSSYWKGEKYLGLGPSAHSYDGVSRQWNIANNHTYIREVFSGGVYFEREALDEKTRLNEYLLTRLRTKWGISAEEIRKTFPSFADEVCLGLNRELNSGNLIESGGMLILSEKGKLLGDHIVSELMIA